MKRPTKITEVTPMQLGKKKIAIGIALGTLVFAILSLTTIGSASKCTTECSGAEVTEQWLTVKTGMKQSVKQAYAVSTVSHVKSNTSTSITMTQAVQQIPNSKARDARRTSTDRNAEDLRKALIALLIVAATESIQQSISH